jgi:hypothetical protein
MNDDNDNNNGNNGIAKELLLSAFIYIEPYVINQ